jgi:hypothetical protein
MGRVFARKGKKMKYSLLQFICLLNFTVLIKSSGIPSIQIFKTSIDKFQDIKENLNESHFLPKSVVNNFADQKKQDISNNILPKGNYQDSCKSCTCVGNLLSCTGCKDKPYVSKNLSYSGICSESQNITYINNFLTPTTGFFYEYLQIIELLKKAFPSPDGTMKMSRSQVAADLVEQLEFTRKHLFPFIQAKNRTGLMSAKIKTPQYLDELKERVKFHIDFDPAKEFATQKQGLQNQDFIKDDILNTIYLFSDEISKFVDSLDTDESSYDDSVIVGFIEPSADTTTKTVDSKNDDNSNETPVEGPKS